MFSTRQSNINHEHNDHSHWHKIYFILLELRNCVCSFVEVMHKFINNTSFKEVWQDFIFLIYMDEYIKSKNYCTKPIWYFLTTEVLTHLFYKINPPFCVIPC